MRTVGIVAEYNPLHKGHEYQIARAKELSSADAALVCLSGNFTQRGDVAVADKWERASWAIDAGADLVVELPTYFAVSDAGRFARGGVSILKAIGCDVISFGSECGDAAVLRMVASRLGACETGITELMKAEPSLSYPAARSRVYRELFGESDELDIIAGSNDILALEYIRWAGDMEIAPVTRVGAGYNDSASEGFEFQSATGIREMLACREAVDDYVPSYVADSVNGIEMKERLEQYFNLVRYAVMSHSAEFIDNMPSGGEGLGARLKQEILKASSIDDLIRRTKSKRYTYTRISRLLVQVVLEIDRILYEDEPRYARVLAFNEKGRKVLKELKNEELPVTVITNISKQLEALDDGQSEMLMLDIHAGNIYSIITERDIMSNTDYLKKPIIK